MNHWRLIGATYDIICCFSYFSYTSFISFVSHWTFQPNAYSYLFSTSEYRRRGRELASAFLYLCVSSCHDRQLWETIHVFISTASSRTNVIPPHLSSIPRAMARQAKMTWRMTGVGWTGLAFRSLDLARRFKLPR